MGFTRLENARKGKHNTFPFAKVFHALKSLLSTVYLSTSLIIVPKRGPKNTILGGIIGEKMSILLDQRLTQLTLPLILRR